MQLLFPRRYILAARFGREIPGATPLAWVGDSG
jgi:hypothetical protein